MLDRNFQQILYQGLVISFTPIYFALMIYVGLRFIYSHALLPALDDWLRQTWKRKRQFLKLRHRLFGKRKDSPVVKRAKQHSVTFAWVAAAFLALLLIFAYAESKGMEKSASILERMVKPIPDQELITVQMNGQLLKLLYLTCGARNCAGIEPNTRIVHYFPQNGHSYYFPVAKVKQPSARDGTTK